MFQPENYWLLKQRVLLFNGWQIWITKQIWRNVCKQWTLLLIERFWPVRSCLRNACGVIAAGTVLDALSSNLIWFHAVQTSDDVIAGIAESCTIGGTSTSWWRNPASPKLLSNTTLRYSGVTIFGILVFARGSFWLGSKNRKLFDRFNEDFPKTALTCSPDWPTPVLYNPSPRSPVSFVVVNLGRHMTAVSA